MESQKTFVVGDIHGCFDMLKRLLDEIPWRQGRDRLVFVGDCIDRGPHSKAVVDSILSLIQRDPQVSCLLGNHEAMLLDYLAGIDPEVYLANKGGTTLRDYQAERPKRWGPLVPPDHMAFYRSLRPFLELERYYVVHAGFRPGIEIERQALEDMVWIREPFISKGDLRAHAFVQTPHNGKQDRHRYRGCLWKPADLYRTPWREVLLREGLTCRFRLTPSCR